jgi:hypothetical protein
MSTALLACCKQNSQIAAVFCGEFVIAVPGEMKPATRDSRAMPPHWPAEAGLQSGQSGVWAPNRHQTPVKLGKIVQMVKKVRFQKWRSAKSLRICGSNRYSRSTVWAFWPCYLEGVREFVAKPAGFCEKVVPIGTAQACRCLENPGFF